MKRKKKHSNSWKELRQMALLLGTIVVVAGGLVGWFVLRHKRLGRYVAKNVLLAPDLLIGAREIHEIEPTTRLQRSWVFDRVEAVHHGKTSVLAPEAYARVYERMASLRSCREPKEELELAFAEAGVVRLRLMLTPGGRYAAAFSSQEFQEVQLAPTGGLVRVQLPERGGRWAYFRVPGIYRQLSWGSL